MSDTAFLDALKKDIENDALHMPVLPEIALEVRDAVEDEMSTAESLAAIIEKDPVVSARIIQVANSALFRRAAPVEDLKSAIVSLGMSLIKGFVVGAVMKEMFKPDDDTIDSILRSTLKHSAEVAALCRMLATGSMKIKGINADTAFLAGLMHDIGVIPILMYAHESEHKVSKEDLERAIEEHHSEIGKAVLESWNFPDEIVQAVSAHEDMNELYNDTVDYTDIVIVANIEALIHSGEDGGRFGDIDLAEIPAFKKLGIDPSADEEIIVEAVRVFE